MLDSLKRKLGARIITGALKGTLDSDKATTGLGFLLAAAILQKVDVEKLLASDPVQFELLGAAVAVALWGWLTNRKRNG